MKIYPLLILHCTFLLGLMAEPTEKEKVKRPMTNSELEGFKQMEIELLQRLLKAKPEKLRVMRKTIERVELMSQEQRKTMSERLRHFRNAPIAEKQRVMMTLKTRTKTLSQYWRKLDPQKKRAEMEHFRTLNEAERGNYFKKVKSKLISPKE